MSRCAMLIAALALLLTACGSDDGASPSSSTVAPGRTDVTTSIPDASSTSITSDPISTSTSESIPPVTPPANQPAACSLVSRSTLEALGVEDVQAVAEDQPNGTPAPSNGCHWPGDPAITVSLFYGADPLEILALVRQSSPGGTDVTGLGQDAYQVGGTVYVDAGSRAFGISGDLTREQVVSLAQGVLANL